MGTHRGVKVSVVRHEVAAQNSCAPHCSWLVHGVGMAAQEARTGAQIVTSSIVVIQTPLPPAPVRACPCPRPVPSACLAGLALAARLSPDQGYRGVIPA